MAVITPTNILTHNSNFDLNETVLPIGGRLIHLSGVYSESFLYDAKNWKDFVRSDMSHKLAKVLVEKYTEFTSITDHLTGNLKVNARCYLAPDDQVRLLRMNYNGLS